MLTSEGGLEGLMVNQRARSVLIDVREVLLPANANPLISPAENPANNHVGENSLNISQTFFITSPALRAVGCYCQNQLLVVS